MEPTPIVIPPGVIKDATDYEAKGRWTNSNRIRFVGGQPQPIGGWVKAFATAVVGVCRSLFSWTDFDGAFYMGMGTNKKWYVEADGTFTDITPIRATAALGANPIATVNLSSIITITHASHGASVGDYVTLSGATTFNGIAAAALNQEFSILTVPTVNTYTVDTGDAASATSSGGGAGVSAAYQLAIGVDSVTVTSGGWGAGGWGHTGGWGSAYTASFGTPPMGHWSQGNWGEWLVGATRGGAGIYYWDPNVSASRAANISTLGGAAETPVKCSFVLVDGDAKYALAFATNVQGDTAVNQLHYRWCDQGDLSNWDSTDLTATAGANDLTHGSMFMTAGVVGSEILVFTNTAIFALSYLGPPLVYGQSTKAVGHKIYGIRTFCASKTTGYWWSNRGFFKYNGLIDEVECPLKEWVYKNADPDQKDKAYAWFDPDYGEAWFFFQSLTGTDVDTYVKYNEEYQVWDLGSLDRTAFIPGTVYPNPRGIDYAGYTYDHESGVDDLSTGTPVNVGSYATVGAMDINNGDKSQFLKSLWNDVDFTGSTTANPEMTLTLTFKNKPGSANHSTFTGTVIGDGDEFTERFDVGQAGRSMGITVSTGKPGSFWSLGVLRGLFRAVRGR